MVARTERSTSGLLLQRRATTHHDIALAAATLFEEQGYDATTVDQIASGAGLSLRTFYRYCSTKDDVFTTILVGGFAKIVDELSAATTRRSYADLAELAVGVMSDANPDIDLMKRLLAAALEAPALQARWIAAGRQAQEQLAVVLAERLGADPFTSSTLAALTMSALSTGLEYALTEGAPLEASLRSALSVVSRGASATRP